MGHDAIAEAVALILSAAVIAYACFRVGLVPIVGFLVAGVVIGPHGIGLVRDQEMVDAAAEIGVMFLLFTIGIEFSLEKLGRIKRLIFGGGGLQVVSASLAMLALLAAFGVDWRAGLFTGFLVALSSTAIVLKLLADRLETNSPHGQVALGLLIFQDLAVIVMVLLVPMLAGGGGSAGAIGWALGKAGAIIALVLIVARRIMPPVLEQVARTCSPELFLLSVIAICFGTAFLTNLAGVSLSLGAFLAGLVVSESRFSEHALGEILPLQILFSAAFFVSVGMLLDLGFLLTHLPLVLLAVVAVLLVKVVTTAGSVRALGYPLPVVAASGLMLAQVGEFSFVLERAGRALGLSPAGLGADGSQVFIASTVLLMVATPLLTSLGVAFGRRVGHLEEVRAEKAAPETAAHAGLENHVVVAGYGEAARRLVRMLHGSHIPYVITTLNPAGANEAEADGLPVLRGDATKLHTLQLAGVERAKLLVIADDDPGTARRIAAVARTINPTMRILVRTPYVAEVEALAAVGVDRVIAEELESVVQLFTDVMRTYNIDGGEILENEENIRRAGYAALRSLGRPAGAVAECTLGPDCLDRRTVLVRDGAPAVGQTLADLDLERRFAIAIEALRRGANSFGEPDGSTVVVAGDELLLAGSADAFAQAAPLFRVGTLSEAEAAAIDAAAERRRVDTSQTIELHPAAGVPCDHLDRINVVRPRTPGCEECLRDGTGWVHLRICMSCGHVGCCDSSPHKHATGHWHETQHPIMRSLEPGETWGWCFPEKVQL
ncbi:MAG TPA: cation:proton antiporter [Candidatus Dormibacteraeota bacterium]|nr:cation:proton antiporter [Candidatus Dormibacteraeota bacterium]